MASLPAWAVRLADTFAEVGLTKREIGVAIQGIVWLHDNRCDDAHPLRQAIAGRPGILMAYIDMSHPRSPFNSITDAKWACDGDDPIDLISYADRHPDTGAVNVIINLGPVFAGLSDE